MIKLIENEMTVQEYLDIRAKVNWVRLTERQAKMAIENSLLFVKAIDDDGNIVGMGRIIGDGAVVCYIQDLVVIPEAQKTGIGTIILNRLIEFAKSIKEENSRMMLCLMCAKGREAFYLKHDFIARPNDNLGPGMIQYLE